MFPSIQFSGTTAMAIKERRSIFNKFQMVGRRKTSIAVALHAMLALSRWGTSSSFAWRPRSLPMSRRCVRLFLTTGADATATNDNNPQTSSSSSSSQYFLMKSEPDEFSIQDLEQCQEQEWDGIRSFQARNKLRAMQRGDLAFFYHSSCKVPGIVGIMRVVREAAPDVTALDPNHKNYDAKSTSENCRWDSVRVGIDSIFENPVTLQQLRKLATTDEVIGSMSLLRQSRLSVHDVTLEQWNRILELAANNKKPFDQEDKEAASDPVPKESKRTRKRKSSS